MAGYRTIRVTIKTYEKLAGTAGKLQIRLGRRVSLSDALAYLVSKRDKSARVFWSNLKEKSVSGRAGRGPRLAVLDGVSASVGGHRREVS